METQKAKHSTACSECINPFSEPLSRRTLMKYGVLATGALAMKSSVLQAAPTFAEKSETLASQLYKSLTSNQRSKLCFDFDHPLREKVDNNWMITKESLQQSLNPDQRDLVRQLYRKLHSPEFEEKAMQQMIHDSEGKGFDGGTSIALFGQPGTGKFEFVLTGRHCTRRCDGDSVDGVAFGGPIFYGHQAGDKDAEPADHPGNVFWFQAKRVNDIFQALDGKQRETALVDIRSRSERATETVKLGGNQGQFSGIRLGELAKDQQRLVHDVMRDLLSPFRKPDADESMRHVHAQGMDRLYLSYFKRQDVGNDGVWDVWQIEGPHMLWYFRGEPHVHCWVHIRQPKA